MRTVEIFKRVKVSTDDGYEFEMQSQGFGKFHQFGHEYEEFESGPGNYTVAIVELPDGRIETVFPNMIRFI